uniref:Uncharacterized protein n=1 Tax=Knipowitschia caucasica TaxID=637954 RepID=A0AAV2L9R3_KNICA
MRELAQLLDPSAQDMVPGTRGAHVLLPEQGAVLRHLHSREKCRSFGLSGLENVVRLQPALPKPHFGFEDFDRITSSCDGVEKVYMGDLQFKNKS